jgi:4-hydroxy-tetrahydrodipicolinate reductase
MQNVKVIIWGLGAMGGGMAKMLLNKKVLTL